LSVFSQKTRALWNPLNINPELSDMESEDEYEHINETKKITSKNKIKENPKEEVYEIEYDGIDTLNGSDDDSNTIQSDKFLKMSHISTKKSNSTNSNIQDCQDLVNGLENGSSLKLFENQKKSSHAQEQRSENFEINRKKEDFFMPSFDLNNKSQPMTQETKGEITIIKSKIMPDEESSQMQVYELVTNSKEFVNQENLETQNTIMNCVDKSDETTQITRINSESQKSNCSQNGKISGIDIVKNYSFVHELELATEKKQKIKKPFKMISPVKNKLKPVEKNLQIFEQNPTLKHDKFNISVDKEIFKNNKKGEESKELINLQQVKKKQIDLFEQNSKIINREKNDFSH
jgi:hypothetical protein